MRTIVGPFLRRHPLGAVAGVIMGLFVLFEVGIELSKLGS